MRIRANGKGTVEVSDVHVLNLKDNWVQLDTGVILSLDKVNLLFGSGHTDVNGVEIFEGDVLKEVIDYTDFGEGIVEDLFVYDNDEGKLRLHSSRCNGGTIEIVGKMVLNEDILNKEEN